MKLRYLSILILFVCLVSCNSDNGATASKAADQTADTKPSPSKVEKKSKSKTIVFFGDSLSAGLGLDKEKAFPNLIQKKITEADLDYKVVNAGLSGETTAGGLRRVDWILKQKIDVFVLELGGNDALRGLPTEDTYKNLNGIIDKVETKYPEAKILLTGMEAPPNLGSDFTKRFRENFQKISKDRNIKLLPFLLDKVAGETDLNQADGIHPTAEGHEIIAGTVWEYLREML